ncbi:hypothetical protein Fmac_010519 [Flemingia macrophylla]|uniref:Uncharacterized protein n=1 Tax=Flemingia macrophylla TaxID=520843 RepID=A0ABD1MJT3_9FABA
MKHDESRFFTLAYKLWMLPKDTLPFIRFRTDPRDVVRKLTRKSTKSPSVSANLILFSDLLIITLISTEPLKLKLDPVDLEKG